MYSRIGKTSCGNIELLWAFGNSLNCLLIKNLSRKIYSALILSKIVQYASKYGLKLTCYQALKYRAPEGEQFRQKEEQ